MLAAWGKIAGRALAGIGCPDDELATRIAAEFHARRCAADRLFADARPCLDALRARGHVLGLVTNGRWAQQTAARTAARYEAPDQRTPAMTG